MESRWIAGMLLAVAASAAAAQVQVQVEDAWLRATVPAQKSSGAFMRLKAAHDVRLVQVRTPVAGVAELHEMAMDGNVMRMRAIPGLDLPAGKAVELTPGGHHVMLMALKQQLKAGAEVPITLVFEDKGGKRQELEIKAAVRPLSGGGEHQPMHKH